MANQKHLSLEERILIKEMLDKRCSFTKIGKALDKDPSTISKEVRNHLVFSRVGYKYVKYNACEHRFTCNKTNVCSSCNPDKKYKKCRNCPACNKNCHDFVEVKCQKLFKPPYVCNGCYQRINGCTLENVFIFPIRLRRNIWKLFPNPDPAFHYPKKRSDAWMRSSPPLFVRASHRTMYV